jgi:hypothetical protein
MECKYAFTLSKKSMFDFIKIIVVWKTMSFDLRKKQNKTGVE